MEDQKRGSCLSGLRCDCRWLGRDPPWSKSAVSPHDFPTLSYGAESVHRRIPFSSLGKAWDAAMNDNRVSCSKKTDELRNTYRVFEDCWLGALQACSRIDIMAFLRRSLTDPATRRMAAILVGFLPE